MSGNILQDMHCALETRLIVRPGTTGTVYQDLLVPSGYYIFTVEDDKKKISLLKSHTFASGEVLVTTKDGNEILKTSIDFHREYPFIREIHVDAKDSQDGANEEERETLVIKIALSITSNAHIKKVRMLTRLLTKNPGVKAQVITSQTDEFKKGRKRTTSSSPESNSGKSTPSSSFSELPSVGSGIELSPLSPLSAHEEEQPRPTEKHNIDIVEKDIMVIQKNTTYTQEGVEQSNSTQIHMEHTKTITESTEVNTDKQGGSSSSEADTFSNYSQSTVDPTEENLVYFRETKLKKKIVTKEQTPIQQKGRYYLVIENVDKKPINRHFSCHLTLTDGNQLIKESYTNDAKRKICDDFTLDTDTATLTLELVNTNSSFGSTDIQISLYMKNKTEEKSEPTIHPHLRTGEVVWSVSACEVEKKHPKIITANIPGSGRYYVVVEKVDKIYGGLREIAVTATLIEPAIEKGADPKRSTIMASVVVGGIKERPMKWKSASFTAPAGSIIEFNVESYALVGSIIYSLRLRKVPGLTAEDEQKRKMVVLFMSLFGIYYLLYLALSFIYFIQNIGFRLPLLVTSIDITIGRICCVLFIIWFRANQELLIPGLKEILETVRKIIRKIGYLRDMSDGGKFDILRIFKKMSKEGKANDRRKWARQKVLTENE